LLMSADERSERARAMRQIIARHDINRWLEVQMAAFEEKELKLLGRGSPVPGRPASRGEPPALIAGGVP
jgi:trehalose-6-phosphate synthase